MLMVNSRWVEVGSKRLLPASGILGFFLIPTDLLTLFQVFFFSFEVILMMPMSNNYVFHSHYQLYCNIIKTDCLQWSKH